MCHHFTTSRRARCCFPALFLCAVLGGVAFSPRVLFGDAKAGDAKARAHERLSQVASPRVASMSAAEVAEGMLKQNRTASSIEGAFEFTVFMNMGQRRQNVAVKDLRPFAYAYSGVFTADEKFNLVQHIPVWKDGKQVGTSDDYRCISDGKRILRASDGYVRIAAVGTKVDDALQQDYENVQEMATWLSRVNSILESDGLQVTGEETDPRHGRVILAQQPLSKTWKRKFRVAVDRGFVALETELFDPVSGDIVYRNEARDLREVEPGVWRPMTWTRMQYLAVMQRGVHKGVRDEKGVPTLFEVNQLKIVKLGNLNKDRPDRLFGIEPPADARKIFEYDEAGNEVEVPTRPGIGSRGSGRPEEALVPGALRLAFGWRAIMCPCVALRSPQ